MVSGYVTRARNIIPAPKSAGSPVPAEQTHTVVKYPGALDTAPAVADDATPLVSLWTSFLQGIAIAVQAELGPIATNPGDPSKKVGGHSSLADLLDRISVARAGLRKGILVGAWRATVSKIGTGYNALSSFTISDVGFRTGTTPIVFAYTNQQRSGVSDSDMNFGPTVVRANAEWISPRGLQVFYRGGKCGITSNGGDVTSTKTYLVEFTILFMAESDPSG